MNYIDIVLIGIALSMDAFGVTLTNGMIYKNETRLKKLSMPLFFGVFQAAMPLLGFFAGSLFIGYIESYTGYLIFTIFILLAAKMIWDGIKELRNPKQTKVEKNLHISLVLVSAVATSIDALALGVGFSAESNFNIWTAILIIGVITFFICSAALLISKKFGDMLGNKAPFVGGAILIFIALKTLFEWL